MKVTNEEAEFVAGYLSPKSKIACVMLGVELAQMWKQGDTLVKAIVRLSDSKGGKSND